MKYRIAMWAAAGFVVASGRAVYFLVRSKDHLIEPLVSTLIRLTCSIAAVGSHHPISRYAVLVENIATYALIGLTLETVHRRIKPLVLSDN
jgi:hypothetical protein